MKTAVGSEADLAARPPDLQDTATAGDAGVADPAAGLRPRELVLLHGQPGSAADWQQLARRLPAALRAVAVDRPGYGASPLPPAGFAANARAVLDEMDSRGIQRAVLVGHSYGGGVALMAASMARHRVEAADGLRDRAGDVLALGPRVEWTFTWTRGLVHDSVTSPLVSELSPIAVVVGAPRRPRLRLHRSMARWLIGRPNVQAVVVPA